MPAPSWWDCISLLPAACRQGKPVPPGREHNPSSVKPLAPVTHHSRNLCLTFCRWCVLGSPDPAGMATSSTRTATSCTTSTTSLYSSGTHPQARNNPTQFLAAACGRFYAVILQETSDHAPRVSDQFIAYTGGTDLAILLNKDTFEPDAAVFAISEASTSKETWGMAALAVRGLVRRPSLSGAQSMSTMLWPRSVTPQPLFFDVSTPTWCSTTSTSSEVAST